MTTINDDARMAELYQMRSEGVELECEVGPDKWADHNKASHICATLKYRPKPKPLYVWAKIKDGEAETLYLIKPTPQILKLYPEIKRYQLIEAPEDE